MRILAYIISGIIIIASLVLSSVVFAGSSSIQPMQINTVYRYANGALGDTRNTPDSTQYAECGSNKTTGYCTIRDSGGTYYSCYTSDAGLIDVIRSMSGDAYISVSWDTSNKCTYILSYASSRAEPKDH